jgi:intraflagellar transport protein 140
MHLGLIEDAKILLQECGRWDLLIKFNISIGDYERAIEISSKNERINLKNSYYRIAQNFEKSNQMESAIEYYKLSGTQHREIPRMLIQKNKLDILEEFINKETDPEFYIWWASYQERNDNVEQALSYYKKANDYSNIVRILIASNDIDEAKKICKETKDRGACFLLGRAMEDNNDIKSAIFYYGMSMRINQAFRLAKEHNLDAEIYNLGLQAPQATKNTIAEYFERKNDYIKSAKLYQLAGNIKNALNICLVSQQYDLIRYLMCL